MKKILLVAIMVVLVQNISFAMTPPANVQKAFEAKFKTATNLKWGKEGKTEQEATFCYEGNKLSANFAENGGWEVIRIFYSIIQFMLIIKINSPSNIFILNSIVYVN